MPRYGLRCVLRARRRFALFLALMTGLTACVTLSFGMLFLQPSDADQCDAYYNSIAVVEYRGGDSSGQDAADDYARGQRIVWRMRSSVDGRGTAMGSVQPRCWPALDGYTRTSGTIPYEDMGVIVVDHILSTPVYTDQLTTLHSDQQPELLVAMSTQSSELVGGGAGDAGADGAPLRL